MAEMVTSAPEPCDSCEANGFPYPGILWRPYQPDDFDWSDRRRTMRCDACARYESDAAARKALRELLTKEEKR